MLALAHGSLGVGELDADDPVTNRHGRVALARARLVAAHGLHNDCPHAGGVPAAPGAEVTMGLKDGITLKLRSAVETDTALRLQVTLTGEGVYTVSGPDGTLTLFAEDWARLTQAISTLVNLVRFGLD